MYTKSAKIINVENAFNKELRTIFFLGNMVRIGISFQIFIYIKILNCFNVKQIYLFGIGTVGLFIKLGLENVITMDHHLVLDF